MSTVGGALECGTTFAVHYNRFWSPCACLRLTILAYNHRLVINRVHKTTAIARAGRGEGGSSVMACEPVRRLGPILICVVVLDVAAVPIGSACDPKPAPPAGSHMRIDASRQYCSVDVSARRHLAVLACRVELFIALGRMYVRQDRRIPCAHSKF